MTNRRLMAPVFLCRLYLQRGLNRHRRFDSRVRIVTFNLEVFKAVVEYRPPVAI
jgi:hypothetical protein